VNACLVSVISGGRGKVQEQQWDGVEARQPEITIESASVIKFFIVSQRKESHPGEAYKIMGWMKALCSWERDSWRSQETEAIERRALSLCGGSEHVSQGRE